MTAPGERPSPQPADAPLLLGVVVLLMVMVLRCITTMDPFPYWSADPMLQAAPVLGLTPARSMIVDCIALIATLLVIIRCARSIDVPHTLALLATFAAAGVVAFHAVPSKADALDAAVQGTSWITAILGAIALSLASRTNAAVRPITLATLAGVLLMILVRGGMQVFVEHPQSMASFKETKDAFFAAQGWKPDSPMAKAFLRRMEQPEASGWFGYANVFATLAAAGSVLLGGLAFHAHRTKAAPWVTRSLAIAAVMSVLGVVLAGSKGGYAVLVLGLGLLAIAPWTPKIRGLAPILGLGVIAATLLAIVARGLIGERLGELSLLFRWFYMQAATRIFGEHPLLGVGPSGHAFKDAYLLAKNPRSPEEVASPHCLPLDWLATLGIGGVLLLGVWLASLARAGRVLAQPPTPTSDIRPTDIHRSRTLLTLICIVPTMIAGLLEREGAIAETAIVRLLGCGLAILVARAVLDLFADPTKSPWRDRAIAAAALCAAAHCCIELTGVTGGANAWCFALLAVVGARALRSTKRTSVRTFACILVLLGYTLLAVGVAIRTALVHRWESTIRSAYDSCELLRADNTKPNSTPLDPSTIARTIQRTGDLLSTAQTLEPGHFGMLRALVRTRLAEATVRQQLALATTAMDQLTQSEPQFSAKSQYWTTLASAIEARRTLLPESEQTPARRAAIRALERAQRLTPTEWQITQRLSDLNEAVGDLESARRWATLALAQSDALDLDPIKQMPADVRARLEARLRP